MVFDHYQGHGSELLLAVKLADNAHEDGTHIFPAVATLAAQTRQSERTVQYQLKRMLATTWLVLVRYEGGGRGRAREYRINPLWLAAHDVRLPESERPKWAPAVAVDIPQEDALKGAESAPFTKHERVQPGAQKGAIAVAGKGAIAVAPEPPLTVIEPNTPLPPAGGEPGFKAFFAAYPRQVDEAKARAEWDKLTPDAVLQREILASVLRWRATAEWQREDGKYIPKPGNWLRNSRWRDVPGIASPPRALAPPPKPERPAAPMPADVRQQVASILGSRNKRHSPIVRTSA